MRLPLAWMFIAAISLGAPAVAASDAPLATSRLPETAEADRASPVCFFAKPRSSCLQFPLTEMRVATLLGDAQGTNHPKLVFSWEFGWMGNIASSDAIGASLYLRSDTYAGGLQWGLKLRYRRWLDPSFALDVAPGIVPTLRGSTEFTGTVGLSYRDWIAFDLQVETFPLPFGARSPQAAFFAGIRVGGLPGSIAAPLTLAGLAAAYALVSGSD